MPEMKIPAPGPSDPLSLVLILGRKSERKRIKEDAKAAKKRDKELKSKGEQHDREIDNELAEMKKALGAPSLARPQKIELRVTLALALASSGCSEASPPAKARGAEQAVNSPLSEFAACKQQADKQDKSLRPIFASFCREADAQGLPGGIFLVSQAVLT